MTVHNIRPPRKPKPPKREELFVDHSEGLTIRFDIKPAEVKPFPKKKDGA